MYLDNVRKLSEKPECLGMIYRADCVIEHIDMTIICPCGESLYIYQPEHYYQCTKCNRVFKAEISVSMDYYTENGLTKAFK